MIIELVTSTPTAPESILNWEFIVMVVLTALVIMSVAWLYSNSGGSSE